MLTTIPTPTPNNVVSTLGNKNKAIIAIIKAPII